MISIFYFFQWMARWVKVARSFQQLVAGAVRGDGSAICGGSDVLVGQDLSGGLDGGRPVMRAASEGALPVDDGIISRDDGTSMDNLIDDGQEVVDEEDIHEKILEFLKRYYEFRYNVLTDQVEGRRKGDGDFRNITKRVLNTIVIDARKKGVKCWDRDVERLLRSEYIGNYHPFHAYMESLPAWDGVDRVTPLAQRVDSSELWVNGFRLWMLGMASQWMGRTNRCANTLTPLLISPKQGLSKSTFCRLLMPPELRAYYLDKFDLTSKSNVEMKLGQFGLINLDEFDRYSAAAMASFKNLVQLKELTVRKAYANYFLQLPRIASFIGTSNQMELLNDPSGSRRFLCVEVKNVIDCSALDHKQLYAQLKVMVEEGERVWMNSSEEVVLQQHNQLFMRLRPEEEVFHEVYVIPTAEEDGVMYTATEIHRRLCQHNPGAMRGINVQKLGKTLTCMGIKRVHTKVGNKYRLVVRG